MCFVRRWFLSVVLFAMEPLLSAQMMIGLLTGNPTSSKYLDIHKAWVVVLKNAMNSASTVDNATVSCLLHSQEIGPPATTKTFPSVERLVSLQPA